MKTYHVLASPPLLASAENVTHSNVFPCMLRGYTPQLLARGQFRRCLMLWLIVIIPAAAFGLLGLGRYVVARPQQRHDVNETSLADAVVGSSPSPSTATPHAAKNHASDSASRYVAPDERELLRQRDVIARETVRHLRRGNAKWPHHDRSALATLYADSTTLGAQKRKIDALLVAAQGSRQDSSQITLHMKLAWLSVMHRFDKR